MTIFRDKAKAYKHLDKLEKRTHQPHWIVSHQNGFTVTDKDPDAPKKEVSAEAVLPLLALAARGYIQRRNQ